MQPRGAPSRHSIGYNHSPSCTQGAIAGYQQQIQDQAYDSPERGRKQTETLPPLVSQVLTTRNPNEDEDRGERMTGKHIADPCVGGSIQEWHHHMGR